MLRRSLQEPEPLFKTCATGLLAFLLLAFPVIAIAQPSPSRAQLAQASLDYTCDDAVPGRECPSLEELLPGTEPGGVLELPRGRYRQCMVIDKPLTVKGNGSLLYDKLCDDKAAIVQIAGPVVIEDLECAVGRFNRSAKGCLRLEPGRSGDVTLRRVHFRDSRNGVMGGDPTMRIVVEDSVFEGLGRTHGLYVFDAKEVIIRRSRFIGSRDQGHEIKSQAARLVIEDSVLDNNGGVDSRLIDIFVGGELIIRNSVLREDGKSANWEMIGYRREPNRGAHPVNRIVIEGSTFHCKSSAVPLGGDLPPTIEIKDSKFEGNCRGVDDLPTAAAQPSPSRAQLAEASSDYQCDDSVRGKTCPSLKELVTNVEPGGVLELPRGRYRQCMVIDKPLTVKGNGSLLYDKLCGDKAAIVQIAGPVVIEDLECAVGRFNRSAKGCLRLEPGRSGDVTLRRVHFRDSRNGVMGGDPTMRIVVEDSVFEGLGRTHGLYVFDAKEVIIRRSRFIGSRDQGHEIKSQAARLVIEDSVLDNNGGVDSRLIDIFVGGELIIRNSVLREDGKSANWEMIGYRREPNRGAHPVNRIVIEGSTFHCKSSAVPLGGDLPPTIEIKDSKFEGNCRGVDDLPTAAAQPSQREALQPQLDASYQCDDSVPGKECPSLSKLLRDTESGDVLELPRGRYRQCMVIDKPLTLKGNGSLLYDKLCGDKAAIVQVAGPVVIEDLECAIGRFDQSAKGCLRLEPGRSGDVTLRKVHFRDSRNGVMGGDPSMRIVIEDSLFEGLGRTHGLYVFDAKEVIIRRSRFIGNRDEGHEIKTQAARLVIEDSLLDNRGSVDSRLIDAYIGGDLVIRNSVFSKDAKSSNWEMIGYRREPNRGTHPVNRVVIEDSTFFCQAKALPLGGELPNKVEIERTHFVGDCQDVESPR